MAQIVCGRELSESLGYVVIIRVNNRSLLVQGEQSVPSSLGHGYQPDLEPYPDQTYVWPEMYGIWLFPI